MAARNGKAAIPQTPSPQSKGGRTFPAPRTTRQRLDCVCLSTALAWRMHNAAPRHAQIRWFVVPRFRNYLILYQPHQETTTSRLLGELQLIEQPPPERFFRLESKGAAEFVRGRLLLATGSQDHG